MGELMESYILPNREVANAKFSRIGMHCHEFAHLIGIGHASGSRADLMEAGSRNGPNNRGAAPAPLNPTHRALKGWLTPTVITGQQQFDAYYSLTAPQIFRINSNYNNDYFLFENRRFNQTMVIGSTTVPDYNNSAFFPPAWPHGTITQGIFVWRIKGGTPPPPGYYYDNGLIYASGIYGANCPEGTPSETDDGVPFPGNCDVKVLSPWSDSRNPYLWEGDPSHYTIYVPNTKNGTNVGMEVVSENSAAGYFTLKLYQTYPENLSPSKPKNLTVQNFYNYGDDGYRAGGLNILSPRPTHYHPKLTWTANNEPDMNQAGAVYEIYRGGGLIATVPYTQTYFIDLDITAGNGNWVYYRIKAKDTQQLRSTYSNTVSYRSNMIQKLITQTGDVPINYSLKQNYPNPFNPKTDMKFDLPEEGIAKLTVYDVLGREVSVLVNEYLSRGCYSVSFDGADIPSGVYFYRFQAGKYSEIKKMLLTK
jgi:hypothetical protein